MLPPVVRSLHLRRGFFNLLDELFHDFHQALLELRQRPYPQDAYQYLVNERNIHPSVVREAARPGGTIYPSHLDP